MTAAETNLEITKQIAAILKKNCTGEDDHDDPDCQKCAEMQKDFEDLIIGCTRAQVVEALEAEHKMRTGESQS